MELLIAMGFGFFKEGELRKKLTKDNDHNLGHLTLVSLILTLDW